MSDTENKVNLSTYKKEMKDVLQRLVKTMPLWSATAQGSWLIF